MPETYKIAAAQIAPAFLDLEDCLQKAEHWIAEAGEQGVRLLVFPETWLPGYPVWIDTAPDAARWDHLPVKAVFRRLFENSPEIPSPATERLCAAAKNAGLTLIMGLNERDGRTPARRVVPAQPDARRPVDVRRLGNHRPEREVPGRTGWG